MILDEKGKLFGKVNLLDVIIVGMVIAVLVAAYLFFSRPGSKAAGTLQTVYTVEVTQMDEAYFEHIKPGEAVENGQTRDPMGTVLSVEVKPARVVATNARDGVFQMDELEGKYDGLVTISCDAQVEYPDLMAGKEALKIGKRLALRSESTAMHGYIVGMQYDEEEMGRYAK